MKYYYVEDDYYRYQSRGEVTSKDFRYNVPFTNLEPRGILNLFWKRGEANSVSSGPVPSAGRFIKTAKADRNYNRKSLSGVPANEPSFSP